MEFWDSKNSPSGRCLDMSTEGTGRGKMDEAALARRVRELEAP